MPLTSEMIQSKFLRKEDVKDDVLVSIKDVDLQDMPGDENKQRWVLYFKELPKGLVLNTTTIRVLEKAFGHDTDRWTGNKVTLYTDPNVMFKGQVVGGLRVRPHKPKAAKVALAALAGAAPPEDFNDEVPIQ